MPYNLRSNRPSTIHRYFEATASLENGYRGPHYLTKFGVIQVIEPTASYLTFFVNFLRGGVVRGRYRLGDIQEPHLCYADMAVPRYPPSFLLSCSTDCMRSINHALSEPR